ncbi:DUF5815 family protein [Halorubrum sp. PV6]|uniref:DUF5815 family protein n=1 Tax=Halorubrum sp. PV6 TaxID=634157 RepID=UPI000F856242|nr:DUF5815 family protein [Halorubrum sp. PV6]AZQ14859.1 hypothetical protein DOS48_08465 [Halorubrum sp. PV6]
MSQPRVPGGDEHTIELPCGQTIAAGTLDLGMREYECDCGETHGVVMDVHPPERFLPEFLVEVLREAIETTSEEMPEFDTPHLLGVVLEEFPEAVTAHDASENADVGYAMVWITEFDSRRLHEVVVELVVELMEHAVSHADDDEALSSFEEEMVEFDVAAFVDQYRAERDLEAEDPYA